MIYIYTQKRLQTRTFRLYNSDIEILKLGGNELLFNYEPLIFEEVCEVLCRFEITTAIYNVMLFVILTLDNNLSG